MNRKLSRLFQAEARVCEIYNSLSTIERAVYDEVAPQVIPSSSTPVNDSLPVEDDGEENTNLEPNTNNPDKNELLKKLI